MSVMTTESRTATAGGPRSLVDVLVDTAALVGRIGADRVLDARVHPNEVTITLRSGVDAWELADSLGLPGRRLDFEAGSPELDRIAWGDHVVAGLAYVEMRGDATAADIETYDAARRR